MATPSSRIVIAEVGHNHYGDIGRARELIQMAKDVKCDIVKFQLYDTDKIKKPGDTNSARFSSS